ncbi:MAG TPA: RICIN domain-containing protein [Actinokineospora sp.]|nr:RICIN domain-containing protein [Actinokineospora sp.]
MHLIQYKCDYKDNKRFAFKWAGTDAYSLIVKSTNMCVTPRAHSTADHAVITQDYCRGLDTQVWITEPIGPSTYRLRNRASGLCLTVAWGSTASGQPLDQSTCGAFGSAQSWYFKAS